VPPQVIVLNGGSSAGKSTIARGLQSVLPAPWLTLGVDTLMQAMPPSLRGSRLGIQFEPDGRIIVGDTFRTLEAAWYQGFASIVRAGTPLIVDEVFLGGAASQDRLRDALAGLRVLWVGVHCDAATAAAREAAREDRAPGIVEGGQGPAASQADLVHDGVRYDLEVDTTNASAMDCALVVAELAMGPGAAALGIPTSDDAAPGR
jgi:chloramphenicol 3-O phosphotransferase